MTRLVTRRVPERRYAGVQFFQVAAESERAAANRSSFRQARMVPRALARTSD